MFSLALLQELLVLSGALLLGWLQPFAQPNLFTAAALCYGGWHLLQGYRLWRQLGQDKPLRRMFGWWRLLADTIGAKLARAQVNTRGKKRFRSRFQRIAESFPDAVVMLDPDGRVEWFNRPARSLFRADTSSVVGIPIEKLLPHPEFIAYLRGNDWREPLVFESPNNSRVVLSVQLVRFAKTKRRHLLLARDITSTYLSERMRRDFVANVSHELRTPLTVMRGYLEALLSLADDDAKEREMLASAEAQSFRMQELIEDLLQLSRIEASVNAMELEPVNLSEMVRKSVNQFQSQAQAKQQQIEIQIESEITVDGESRMLRSVVDNLIQNAVQHNGARTLIQVSLRIENEQPVFSVRDNGQGIAAMHIPRITERFYRVDKGPTTTHRGSGLGLAIVKHVMQNHGGEFEIESTAGRGTRFACAFPPQRETSGDEARPHTIQQ
jgi:two-component system phosphate regulon sensor histidine kinase PhoR